MTVGTDTILAFKRRLLVHFATNTEPVLITTVAASITDVYSDRGDFHDQSD